VQQDGAHVGVQIMTLSRGIRGAAGFPRAVAHAAAAVLAVTAMLVAMWAGPLAAASAGTRPRAAFPSPTPVKYYIVPPPGNGPAQSLYIIAAKTLGDGIQFMEIFNLNRGRLQPNGGRLTNPQLIQPGWILQLPADAAGPGVRFGSLPIVTAPASHRPSRSAGTGRAIMISGALAFLTAGLAFRLIRRRAGRTRRRRSARLRAPDVAGQASRIGRQHEHDRYVGPRLAPGPSARSGSPHAGWESRRGATEAALRAAGYSGRAEPHAPSRREAEPPADAASRADITPRPGPVRRESPAGVIDLVRPEADGIQPERVQVRDAGSAQLAAWIISEATTQRAADIGHQARDQVAASLADARQEAAELVRKASEQAAATLATAELEAAKVRATVTRLSAELGGVAAYVTENLGSVAPPAAKTIIMPAVPPSARPAAAPVTEPEARPAARPAIEPGTGPKSRPASQPGTRPAPKPGTRPAPRPEGRPRQLVAIRVAAVATAALFLFALLSGTTEVALHGFRFFVFRSAGTGETGPNGLQEDQGPGQPDATKPTLSHIKIRLGPHGTAGVHKG
jgi:hypothetical protein